MTEWRRWSAFTDETKIWIYKSDGMWIVDLACTPWDDDELHEFHTFAEALTVLGQLTGENRVTTGTPERRV